MITTAQPILKQVSYELGESTPDYSASRINHFNTAYQYYLSLSKWSFKIKEYELTTTGDKEYNLTTLVPDFSQADGIYEVRTSGDGKLIKPIEYEDKDLEDGYYLTPDGKSIGFTSVSSGDKYKIKYYAVLTPVSLETETLNIPIPEVHSQPISTYIQFLVFKRKRQRNDARNAILDFKDQLEDALMREGGRGTVGFVPKIFSPVRKIIGL